MGKDLKSHENVNPEKDPQLQRNKGNDDLDSKVNTDFKSKGYMKSQTDQEDPDTNPDKVSGKPGFNRTQ